MRIVLDAGEGEGGRGNGLEEPKTISGLDEEKKKCEWDIQQ